MKFSFLPKIERRVIELEQKKYMDIERLKDKYVDGFQPGDYVVVQEKIDGANFSIRYDSESGVVKAFSRKKILDLGDNLRGAWGWSQRLNENLPETIEWFGGVESRKIHADVFIDDKAVNKLKYCVPYKEVHYIV